MQKNYNYLNLNFLHGKLTHFVEVVKCYFATSLPIIVLQYFQNVHFLHLKAKCTHRHLMEQLCWGF